MVRCLSLRTGFALPTRPKDFIPQRTLDEAADWLHAAAYNLRFAYKLKGKITIDIKIEQPSETR